MNKHLNRTGLALLLLAAFLLLATTVAASNHDPLADPIPEPIETGALRINLETVATGMTAPNWGTAVPACPNLDNRLVVVDQDGILWALNLDTGDTSVLLDVSDRLVSLGAFGPGTFDERGFLGVAFHPHFDANGLLYTYTSEPVDGPADFSTIPAGESPNNQSVINEWQIPAPCDPASVVDPGSRRELLRIDEPQFNHDAGTLVFGPDNMLYVSLGDGGQADDQGVGHVPGGNGQEPGNVLGTILRLDPGGSNGINGQYGVPADNPFVGVEGALDEIFAYGFRNPFRISFDARTGDLYAADVGQGAIEEIDHVVAGGNYGWRVKEGSFCFDPNADDPGFVFNCGPDDVPPGLIDPIAEYDHDEGIAIVGGFVYRGSEIPPLRGRYVFGDFRQRSINSGRLFYLQQNHEIQAFQLAWQDILGLRLLGFGQDGHGELYVMANESGTPFGDSGVVLRIASAQPRSRNFQAHLTGAEEVPAVETQAQGQANFNFDAEANRLDYELIATNIEDVFASHIHCGPAGVNRPVGVTLYAGGTTTPHGLLAAGTIEMPDDGNSCGWTTLADVAQAIESGNAYVNVHTAAHPAGEIRGQID